MTNTEQIPAWDLGDRLHKALRHSKVGVQEMADYLGVTRTSVGNWINGRNKPANPALKLWAMRTGVDYEWLITGAEIRRPGFCRRVAFVLRHGVSRRRLAVAV